MQWLALPTGRRGRCQKFSDAAIQFCLTIKSLFGKPLRQTLGLVQSLLRMAGLPWPVPDYSTVCRRQNSLNVQVHYRASEKGLHLLADSTGHLWTFERQVAELNIRASILNQFTALDTPQAVAAA